MLRRLYTIVVLGVLALCMSGCPCPPQPAPPPGNSQALNLVWDNRRDPNGPPHNPRWAFQQKQVGVDGPLPLADPEKLCGGFPTTNEVSRRRGDPQCTDQDTDVDLPTSW